MDWISENLGTIVISLVLSLAVILVVIKLIRDKRTGRSSCSCGCSSCAMAGTCHSRKEKEGKEENT